MTAFDSASTFDSETTGEFLLNRLSTAFDSESTFDFEVKSTFSKSSRLLCKECHTPHTILMPRWGEADTTRIGDSSNQKELLTSTTLYIIPLTLLKRLEEIIFHNLRRRTFVLTIATKLEITALETWNSKAQDNTTKKVRIVYVALILFYH